ncbi:MAG: hypothetical protein V2B18_21100 [Pseudomonadota bacterium]
MESEQVTIRLKKDHYVVDAVFHFFNDAEQTTEWVGFPKYGHGVTSDKDIVDFQWFEAWVDGRKTLFVEEGDAFSGVDRLLRPDGVHKHFSKYRWMVHKVTFPALAETTMRVRYAAHYSRGGSAYYLYGTGRYWKGTIGTAVFIIDCADVGGRDKVSVECVSKFEREVLSKDLLRYEIRDVEPSPGEEIGAVVEAIRKAREFHPPARAIRVLKRAPTDIKGEPDKPLHAPVNSP